MKVFTKLGLVLLALVFVAGVHVAQSQVDYGPKIPPKVNIPQTDDLFDLQFDFPVGVGGGEAGIETDGDYIYTSMWNGGGEFQKYDISGTWIETFTIAGTAGCRDIAYTGTYFYGGAASTTVFEMDFAGGTMVSTFSAPTDCRAIAYNEDDDAFYANNWGSAITKFDMAGANLGSFPVGPVGDSYYGFAYQSSALCGDGPFLWGHAQVGNTQNELVQIELPSGTESGVYFDVGTVAAVGTGIAGGLAIHEGLVTGYYTILGTSQNVNIWGLELCVSGPLPDNDLGVQSIVEPTTGVELTATEEVTVAVKNYGNNAQSSFDVWFTLDGGAAVTESVSVTINPGETYDHTFGTTVDLSAMGSYEFEACVVLAGDENADNDCATKTVENLVPSLCVPAYTTGCSLGDGFTDFALEEIVNNGSGCDDLNGVGWSQYFGLGPATLIAGGTHTITMATGYDNNYATVWIDFNDDLLLTEDEKVVDNFLMALAATFYDVDFDVPADAPAEQHIMRARTNWNATCDDPCISYAYGEAEDYYVNVGGAPPVTDCQDFDALTVGGYVAGQLGGLWTTWSGAPGTAEDALVSDAYSVSPSNSMLIEGGTDGLQLFNAATLESGKYYYSHNIYIPDGTTGYWNLQKDIVPAVEWGFQIMYDDDGMYYVDAGAAAAVVAPFSYDTWYFNEFIVDLDNDWAEFYIDGVLIIEYQWTLGTFGNPGLLTLGGANYFANPGAGGAPAGAHFDDVCFEDISPSPCEDFDALTVGGLVAEQLGGYWTTWSGTSADDATVTDAQSNSPSNSFIVDAGTIDLVLQFGDNPISSGQKLYSHYMYVPTGYSGYFNVQSEPTPGVAWVIELFFNDDGTGEFLVQGASTLFDYDMDTWFMVEVNFDLDSQLGAVYFDGTQMVLFDNALTIGGLDYYGWDVGGAPGAYYDDVCFGPGWVLEPPPPPPPPSDLVTDIVGSDIVLTWDAPGGDLIELVQHGNDPQNAYYQAYDNGYGVVYDISAYPGATLELLDFRHSSWGIFGTWDYKLHIVDWDTYTSVTVLDGFQTTGDDQWEEGISLGSVAGQSGLVGVFLEPLSNDPADAYPCLDSDNVGPDGMSYNGALGDFSAFTLSTIGDFLMDLWIMTAGDQVLVKPPKYYATGLSTGTPRLTGATLPAGEYTLEQSSNESKDLTGYNIYYSYEGGAFNQIDFTAQTTYTHVDPGVGYHCYYVTAVYDPEGESDPTNTECETIVGIDENLANSTQVYPNPATDVVHIQSELMIESIVVYNQTGQVIATEAAKDKQVQLNLSQYNPGIYLLRIETEEGVVSKRIIIE